MGGGPRRAGKKKIEKGGPKINKKRTGWELVTS